MNYINNCILYFPVNSLLSVCNSDDILNMINCNLNDVKTICNL